jgi:hypothetical protein
VIVPAEALAQPTALTIETTATPSLAELGAEPVGPTLLLGREGQTFGKPVTVVLPFDAGRVPSGAQARLVVMTAPRGSRAWQPLDSAVDPATATVRAQVTHFSAFVAAPRDLPPPPPMLALPLEGDARPGPVHPS